MICPTFFALKLHMIELKTLGGGCGPILVAAKSWVGPVSVIIGFACPRTLQNDGCAGFCLFGACGVSSQSWTHEKTGTRVEQHLQVCLRECKSI